jgi:ParB-like chromosome segregation protein Spo0J
MKIVNDTTTLEPLDAIRPHPRNPRQGDIGAIHTSINTNGFYGTIIAQRSTGFILAGNHRWEAARQAGAETIPVTWINVDDEHATRILLADNRINDLAAYDDNALAELLQEIHDTTGSLIGTGYDTDDLDQLLNDLGDITPINLPELPSGDKDPFQQMTFTLHDEQVEVLKEAMTIARKNGLAKHDENSNTNGNALAGIAQFYLNNHDG